MRKSWDFISIFIPKLIIGFVLATTVHTNASAYESCSYVPCTASGAGCGSFSSETIHPCKTIQGYVTCDNGATKFFSCATCVDMGYSTGTNVYVDGTVSYIPCIDKCDTDCPSRVDWTPANDGSGIEKICRYSGVNYMGCESRCAANFYMNNGTCKRCPDGTTSVAGSTSSSDCTPSTPKCDADYFLDGNECKECPPSYCYFETDNRSTYMSADFLNALNACVGDIENFKYPKCMEIKTEEIKECLKGKGYEYKTYIKQGHSDPGTTDVRDCYLHMDEMGTVDHCPFI